MEIREAAGPNEMVVGDVPHNEPLDVESVRIDFIEVNRPVHGFIDRRQTVVECD